MTLQIDDLCPIAQEAARRFVDRLRLGQRVNGAWQFPSPKNWRKERQEELLDALVYDVIDELADEQTVAALRKAGAL